MILKATEPWKDGVVIKANERYREPEPPEGFVNNIVYRYKLNPDGTKELISTMDAYPEGWEKKKFVPGRGKQQKEEDDAEMAIKYTKEEKAELLVKAKKLMAEGMSMSKAAKEIGVPVGTLGYWVAIDKKQTPDPEPEELGGTKPVEEKREPAEEIIPETGCPFDEPVYNPDNDEQKQINDKCFKYMQDAYPDVFGASEEDFGAADEDPIPYIPAKEFDSDRFKLKLLEAIRECSWLDNAPDKITLAVMDAVLYADLEV